MLKLISACDDQGLPRTIILGQQVTLGRDNRSTLQSFVRLFSAGRELEISRVHARITRATDGCYISDNESTNGTFVNGSRLQQPRQLVNGDVISLSSAWTSDDVTLPYAYIFDENAPAPVVAPAIDMQAIFQVPAPVQAPADAVIPPFVARPPVDAIAAPAPFLDKLKDQTSCGVCFEAMVAPHVLSSCGHSFCGECIFRWTRQQGKTTCPTCRDPAGDPAYNKIVDDILESTFVPTLNDEQKADRLLREERWHVAKNSFAKKRTREEATAGLVLPFHDIIFPQIVRAMVRQRTVQMVLHQPPMVPMEARVLRDRAIEAVNSSPSTGRLVVFYSLGGEVRANGRGRDRALCTRCRNPINLGDACASTPRGRSLAHTRCTEWSRLPAGLQKLRCEDTSFIYSTGPNGPLELLYD